MVPANPSHMCFPQSNKLYNHAFKAILPGMLAKHTATETLIIPMIYRVLSCVCRGGPTTVDGQKDLSSLADRSPADKRGVPTTTASDFARSH